MISRRPADVAIVNEAVQIIAEALAEHDVPELEGAMAMKMLLNELSEKGIDVFIQKNNLN